MLFRLGLSPRGADILPTNWKRFSMHQVWVGVAVCFYVRVHRRRAGDYERALFRCRVAKESKPGVVQSQDSDVGGLTDSGNSNQGS
jgi:hypothetical protein